MNWFAMLEQEDQEFIKQFIMASGSLKQLAKIYQVSYPTVRIRLNKLIQKVKLINNNKSSTFETKMMQLVVDEKLSLDLAKQIISDFKRSRKNMNDFKNWVIIFIAIAALHFIERFAPKWVGAVPGIAFFILMIYISITHGFSWSIFFILIAGELILSGIWAQACSDKDKKTQRELNKMHARDLSNHIDQ